MKYRFDETIDETFETFDETQHMHWLTY